jgi:hypothetical protein
MSLTTSAAAYQTAFTVTAGMAGPVLVPMPQIIDTVAVTFTVERRNIDA